MATTEFLNVRQAAKDLGVHENTVRNWEQKGLLHGIRLPGSGFRRFPREEVERMRREMFEHYAPPTELPEDARINVKGHAVTGDTL
ncbi:MAG: MerR family transcriptional regulator [Thermoleophilaceae bacterium]